MSVVVVVVVVIVVVVVLYEGNVDCMYAVVSPCFYFGVVCRERINFFFFFPEKKKYLNIFRARVA